MGEGGRNEGGGGQKQGENNKTESDPNHKTKLQRLSFDKYISMYHLATTYFHSSVVKFQFRHGKRPGNLQCLVGFLMLLYVECKNRNKGKVLPCLSL